MNTSYPFNLLPKCYIDYPLDAKYLVSEVKAQELLSVNRFDLYAKLIYIDHKVRGLDMQYALNVYRMHIEVITGCSFAEKGQKDKNSFSRFVDKFNELIDVFQHGEFDPNISLIPVDAEEIILDGAHRTACAAYFNKNVTIVKFIDWFSGLRPNWEWFKERFLLVDIQDAISLEVCNWHTDIYMACFWPKTLALKDKKRSADLLLDEKCDIFVKRQIKLSYNALRNFVMQIYSHMDWVGTVENHFVGALAKVDEIYDYRYDTVEFVLFRANSYDDVFALKQLIRNIFDIGLSSVHITDNHKETKQIAELVFNPNSVHHLIHSVPDKYVDSYRMFENFSFGLTKIKLEKSLFALDSSIVLALYGIREANDLDFIVDIENIPKDIPDNLKLLSDCHNSYLNFYEASIHDLLYCPENYFIHKDVKILTLDRVKQFKEKRAENKDMIDVKLIESFNGNKLFDRFKLKFYLFLNSLRMRLFVFKQKIISLIIFLLKSIGLFPVAKYIYKKIKNR